MIAVRGWLAELPGLLGIVLLIYTAYLGGHLVYDLGVNVTAVKHLQTFHWHVAPVGLGEGGNHHRLPLWRLSD